MSKWVGTGIQCGRWTQAFDCEGVTSSQWRSHPSDGSEGLQAHRPPPSACTPHQALLPSTSLLTWPAPRPPPHVCVGPHPTFRLWVALGTGAAHRVPAYRPGLGGRDRQSWKELGQGSPCPGAGTGMVQQGVSRQPRGRCSPRERPSRGKRWTSCAVRRLTGVVRAGCTWGTRCNRKGLGCTPRSLAC